MSKPPTLTITKRGYGDIDWPDEWHALDASARFALIADWETLLALARTNVIKEMAEAQAQRDKTTKH